MNREIRAKNRDDQYGKDVELSSQPQELETAINEVISKVDEITEAEIVEETESVENELSESQLTKLTKKQLIELILSKP